jgi:thiol-disulfide isomerase/thioredoxin
MPVKEAGLVHAEWCGHCQKLKPDWDTFTGGLEGGNYNGVPIKTLEESQNKGDIEGKGINVEGFPAFYSIGGDNKVTMHDSVGRNTEGFKSWLNKLTGGEEKTEKKEGFMSGIFGGKKSKKSKRKTAKKGKKAKKSKTSKRKTAKKGKKSKRTKRRR